MARRRAERMTTRQSEMAAVPQSETDYAIAVRNQIGRIYGFEGRYGTTKREETIEAEETEPLKLAGAFVGDANGRNDGPTERERREEKRLRFTRADRLSFRRMMRGFSNKHED